MLQFPNFLLWESFVHPELFGDVDGISKVRIGAKIRLVYKRLDLNNGVRSNQMKYQDFLITLFLKIIYWNKKNVKAKHSQLVFTAENDSFV